MLKKYYQKIISQDYELPKLLVFLQKYAKSNSRILDVGCGHGRYLNLLSNQGYNTLGVEKNTDIVAINRGKGMNCVSVDAFRETTSTFDVVICSHIIEHQNSSDLLAFLNFYLERVEKGGYLIIATPLYSNYFYDDFDHVKPYHPVGLQMVFGGNGAQVQYYSDHKLVLRDIWFRKSPFFVTLHRARYIKSFMTRILQILDIVAILCFKLSLRLIGRKDGWIGVFQKC